MDIRKKKFKTSSATGLYPFALKILNKKNPEFLLCDDNAKKYQVGSCVFLSFMLIIKGLLTFLFPIFYLFYFTRKKIKIYSGFLIEIILLRSYESVQLKP